MPEAANVVSEEKASDDEDWQLLLSEAPWLSACCPDAAQWMLVKRIWKNVSYTAPGKPQDSDAMRWLCKSMVNQAIEVAVVNGMYRSATKGPHCSIDSELSPPGSPGQNEPYSSSVLKTVTFQDSHKTALPPETAWSATQIASSIVDQAVVNGIQRAMFQGEKDITPSAGGVERHVASLAVEFSLEEGISRALKSTGTSLDSMAHFAAHDIVKSCVGQGVHRALSLLNNGHCEVDVGKVEHQLVYHTTAHEVANKAVSAGVWETLYNMSVAESTRDAMADPSDPVVSIVAQDTVQQSLHAAIQNASECLTASLTTEDTLPQSQAAVEDTRTTTVSSILSHNQESGAIVESCTLALLGPTPQVDIGESPAELTPSEPPNPDSAVDAPNASEGGEGNPEAGTDEEDEGNEASAFDIRFYDELCQFKFGAPGEAGSARGSISGSVLSTTTRESISTVACPEEYVPVIVGLAPTEEGAAWRSGSPNSLHLSRYRFGLDLSSKESARSDPTSIPSINSSRSDTSIATTHVRKHSNARRKTTFATRVRTETIDMSPIRTSQRHFSQSCVAGEGRVATASLRTTLAHMNFSTRTVDFGVPATTGDSRQTSWTGTVRNFSIGTADLEYILFGENGRCPEQDNVKSPTLPSGTSSRTVFTSDFHLGRQQTEEMLLALGKGGDSPATLLLEDLLLGPGKSPNGPGAASGALKFALAPGPPSQVTVTSPQVVPPGCSEREAASTTMEGQANQPIDTLADPNRNSLVAYQFSEQDPSSGVERREEPSTNPLDGLLTGDCTERREGPSPSIDDLVAAITQMDSPANVTSCTDAHLLTPLDNDDAQSQCRSVLIADLLQELAEAFDSPPTAQELQPAKPGDNASAITENEAKEPSERSTGTMAPPLPISNIHNCVEQQAADFKDRSLSKSAGEIAVLDAIEAAAALVPSDVGLKGNSAPTPSSSPKNGTMTTNKRAKEEATLAELAMRKTNSGRHIMAQKEVLGSVPSSPVNSVSINGKGALGRKLHSEVVKRLGSIDAAAGVRLPSSIPANPLYNLHGVEDLLNDILGDGRLVNVPLETSVSSADSSAYPSESCSTLQRFGSNLQNTEPFAGAGVQLCRVIRKAYPGSQYASPSNPSSPLVAGETSSLPHFNQEDLIPLTYNSTKPPKATTTQRPTALQPHLVASPSVKTSSSTGGLLESPNSRQTPSSYARNLYSALSFDDENPNARCGNPMNQSTTQALHSQHHPTEVTERPQTHSEDVKHPSRAPLNILAARSPHSVQKEEMGHSMNATPRPWVLPERRPYANPSSTRTFNGMTKEFLAESMRKQSVVLEGVLNFTNKLSAQEQWRTDLKTRGAVNRPMDYERVASKELVACHSTASASPT